MTMITYSQKYPLLLFQWLKEWVHSWRKTQRKWHSIFGCFTMSPPYWAGRREPGRRCISTSTEHYPTLSPRQRYVHAWGNIFHVQFLKGAKKKMDIVWLKEIISLQNDQNYKFFLKWRGLSHWYSRGPSTVKITIKNSLPYSWCFF